MELHAFVSAATKELLWLNEKEEEEVHYDWSERNTNMASKKDSYSVPERSRHQNRLEFCRQVLTLARFWSAGSDERAGAPGEEGERRPDLRRQTAARRTPCAADHRGERRCRRSEPEVLLRSGSDPVRSAQSFTAALQTQWSWILQLCCCVETHLKENTAHFQVGPPTRTRTSGPELLHLLLLLLPAVLL